MKLASFIYIRQNSLPDQTAFFINKKRLLSWKLEYHMHLFRMEMVGFLSV